MNKQKTFKFHEIKLKNKSRGINLAVVVTLKRDNEEREEPRDTLQRMNPGIGAKTIATHMNVWNAFQTFTSFWFCNKWLPSTDLYPPLLLLSWPSYCFKRGTKSKRGMWREIITVTYTWLLTIWESVKIIIIKKVYRMPLLPVILLPHILLSWHFFVYSAIIISY